jgi:hypothetical protein
LFGLDRGDVREFDDVGAAIKALSPAQNDAADFGASSRVLGAVRRSFRSAARARSPL